MALIPIYTGLCFSAEGLCESCQHCKTASLEGEQEDVQTSSRRLCASAVSKALGKFLLSLNSPCAPTSGSRTAEGSANPEPALLLSCMPAAQSEDISTKILGNQTRLPSSVHNVASLHDTTAKASRDGNSMLRGKEKSSEHLLLLQDGQRVWFFVKTTGSVVGFRAPDQDL